MHVMCAYVCGVLRVYPLPSPIYRDTNTSRKQTLPRVYDSVWQLPPTCPFTGRRDPSAGSASGSCLCLGKWGLAGGRHANLFFFGKFKGKKREEEEEKEVRPLGGLVRNPAHGRPL